MGQSLPCSKNTIITELFNNSRVNYLISIKAPAGMVDDFKQEFFLSLSEIQEDKLIELKNTNGLILYACRIILNMSSHKNKFHLINRSVDLSEYKRVLSNELKKGYDNSSANRAANYLAQKQNGTSEDFHETLIFSAYVELRSYPKVADYFGVPHYHVKKVISKMRKELQKVVKNDN